MKLRYALLLLISFIFLVEGADASSYSVEFNQIGESVVIKEVVINETGQYNRSFNDKTILSKTQEGMVFLKKISFSKNWDIVKISIILDKGVIISDEDVYPTGYVIDSDGQNIIISWRLVPVKSGREFPIFVKLEDTKKDNSYYWVIIAAIVFTLIWFVSQKARKSKKKTIEKKSSIEKKEKRLSKKDYEYLLDTEKRVIEELQKASRNELWQKQIQLSTGFSKAKVSRLVRNLESRGLIRKIPFGNTNKIQLA